MFMFLSTIFLLSTAFAAASCPQGVSEVLYQPVEGECHSYWICINGTGVKISCPESLLYDAAEEVCDIPEKVKCLELSREETARSSGFLHPDCPAKNPREPVLLPHETDCGKFYICDKGKAHEKTCYPGLHFNTKLKVCDYPERAKCSINLAKKQQPTSCDQADPNELTLLPHDSDCNLFLSCHGEMAKTRKCPEELHFNRRLRVCDFPERAGCEEREVVSTEGPTSTVMDTTGSASPLCPPTNGKHPIFIRHPTDCSAYYMCGNGLVYKFSCPGSLHFNLKKKTCDRPYQAGCREGNDNQDEA